MAKIPNPAQTGRQIEHLLVATRRREFEGLGYWFATLHEGLTSYTLSVRDQHKSVLSRMALSNSVTYARLTEYIEPSGDDDVAHRMRSGIRVVHHRLTELSINQTVAEPDDFRNNPRRAAWKEVSGPRWTLQAHLNYILEVLPLLAATEQPATTSPGSELLV